MVPVDRFALSDRLPGEKKGEEFERALKWMNDGVGELGIEESEDGEEKILPIGLRRSFYRRVSGDAWVSVERILAEHSSRKWVIGSRFPGDCGSGMGKQRRHDCACWGGIVGRSKVQDIDNGEDIVSLSSLG